MKRIIESLLKSIPFSLRALLLRKLETSLSEGELLNVGRNSTFLSLRRLKIQGYNPKFIIDIGAHNGDWTTEVYKIFRSASFIAVEALPTKKHVLERAFRGMEVKIYTKLLGGSSKRNIPFYSMETGSSVLSELTSFSREVIYLDMITLDEIATHENVEKNVLLKLDVQGFEMEVLKGASSVLCKVDIICMELSLLNYNDGAPLADKVIPFMKDLGFVIFDITGFVRKSTDFSLIQADFIFIKEESSIRQKANDMKNEDFVVLQS
jgi:FkbM family methyltransferase